MKQHVIVMGVVVAAAWAGGASPVAAQELGASSEGLFGGFGLGVAQATIDPETEDSAPGLGAQVEARFGFRWESGLGLSLGLSTASFGYSTMAPDVSAFGIPTTTPTTTPELVETDADLGASLIDASAWYFLDLSADTQLGVRGGLGYAQGIYSAGGLSADESGLGAVVSGVLGWRVREHMWVNVDLSWRWANLDVSEATGQSNFSVFALAAGVGWGP